MVDGLMCKLKSIVANTGEECVRQLLKDQSVSFYRLLTVKNTQYLAKNNENNF